MEREIHRQPVPEFNTDNNILDEMYKHVDKTAMEISDDMFTQVCDAFGKTENEVMELMVSSMKYHFERYGNYFTVECLDKE